MPAPAVCSARGPFFFARLVVPVVVNEHRGRRRAPEAQRSLKVPTELLRFVESGHPDLFKGPLPINEYHSLLNSTLHARVAEIDNVRFRPRKRTEKAKD